MIFWILQVVTCRSRKHKWGIFSWNIFLQLVQMSGQMGLAYGFSCRWLRVFGKIICFNFPPFPPIVSPSRYQPAASTITSIQIQNSIHTNTKLHPYKYKTPSIQIRNSIHINTKFPLDKYRMRGEEIYDYIVEKYTIFNNENDYQNVNMQ